MKILSWPLRWYWRACFRLWAAWIPLGSRRKNFSLGRLYLLLVLISWMTLVSGLEVPFLCLSVFWPPRAPVGSSHFDIWYPSSLGADPFMLGASSPSKGSGWLLRLRVQSVDSFVSGEGQGWFNSHPGYLDVPESCPGIFASFPGPRGSPSLSLPLSHFSSSLSSF